MVGSVCGDLCKGLAGSLSLASLQCSSFRALAGAEGGRFMVPVPGSDTTREQTLCSFMLIVDTGQNMSSTDKKIKHMKCKSTHAIILFVERPGAHIFSRLFHFLFFSPGSTKRCRNRNLGKTLSCGDFLEARHFFLLLSCRRYSGTQMVLCGSTEYTERKKGLNSVCAVRKDIQQIETSQNVVEGNGTAAGGWTNLLQAKWSTLEIANFNSSLQAVALR